MISRATFPAPMLKMKNIIWLASYPKSGNTWFRVFLSNLIQGGDQPVDINRLERTPIAGSREVFDEAVGVDAADLSYEEIDRLRPEVYRFLSYEAQEVRYLKIHDAYTYIDDGIPLIPTCATRGVIYVIRNPLDVAISFANHSGISIDKSIERINDESFCFNNQPDRLHKQLRQRLLSWGGHVRSWTEAEDLDLFLLRYEDMKRNPVATFTGAVQFIGLNKSPSQIKKALEFSHFSQLQRQEQENGFQERTVDCKAFFNKGESGYWKDILSDEQTNKIIMPHKEVMTRFGYLKENGEPIY